MVPPINPTTSPLVLRNRARLAPLSRDALILVVDLGTSYFKASLFDLDGELQSSHAIPTPTDESPTGRAEMDCHVFRHQLTDLVRSLDHNSNLLKRVAAISFATQANSFAVFDHQQVPLTPFLLWSDERARDFSFPLQAHFEQPEATPTTGLPHVSHLSMPAKLYWLQQHAPDTCVRAARIGLLSDYLVWWLTGQWLTEAGVAALTGLVDIHRLQWWPEACRRSRISLAWLPEIVRAGTDAGPLIAEVAEAWGVPRDCRFVVGSLDQYAGAIGIGNTGPGMVSETTGTVLASIRCTSKLEAGLSDGVFQGPGHKPDVFYQMVFSEISAGLLDRYRSVVTPDLDFGQLDALAERIPPGAEGLRLRPDAFSCRVTEMFTNREQHHSRGHEVRAILEGIAEELARQVTLLCGQQKPTRVLAGGGAARSKLLLALKSAALGCPVEVGPCAEATSRGAALLAIETLSFGADGPALP